MIKQSFQERVVDYKKESKGNGRNKEYSDRNKQYLQ
jgi:hypothetical protein